MTPIFKVSTGDSELAGVLNRARQNIEERTLLDGENYKVTRTNKGVRLIIDPKKSESTTTDTIVAAPLSMVFRGELSLGLSYSPGDVFVVMGGDNAGLFVTRVPVPAGSSEEPGIGNSFQRLGSYTFGQWT